MRWRVGRLSYLEPCDWAVSREFWVSSALSVRSAKSAYTRQSHSQLAFQSNHDLERRRIRQAVAHPGPTTSYRHTIRLPFERSPRSLIVKLLVQTRQGTGGSGIRSRSSVVVAKRRRGTEAKTACERALRPRKGLALVRAIA